MASIAFFYYYSGTLHQSDTPHLQSDHMRIALNEADTLADPIVQCGREHEMGIWPQPADRSLLLQSVQFSSGTFQYLTGWQTGGHPMTNDPT